MATEGQKPSSEEVKTDLFEDDDEFEEFEIDRGVNEELHFYMLVFFFQFYGFFCFECYKCGLIFVMNLMP